MIRIDTSLIDEVAQESRVSVRQRKNYNFHKELSDTLQRMLNVVQPGSYVQPHKHENPDKREAFILLKGRMVVFEFTDWGELADFCLLGDGTGIYGCEIAPGIFHSIVALEADTVVYEVKDGPYDVMDDKNFASWAPKEKETHQAQVYNAELLSKVGLR